MAVKDDYLLDTLMDMGAVDTLPKWRPRARWRSLPEQG